MIDLTDLEGRVLLHAGRIARTNRMGWVWSSPQNTRANSAVGTLITRVVRRRAGVALVRIGAWLLGARAGTRLGTGRIIRRSGSTGNGLLADEQDHPVMLGFGPDGALYVTYPALEPGAAAPNGVLLRIDLSADAK